MSYVYSEKEIVLIKFVVRWSKFMSKVSILFE